MLTYLAYWGGERKQDFARYLEDGTKSSSKYFSSWKEGSEKYWKCWSYVLYYRFLSNFRVKWNIRSRKLELELRPQNPQWCITGCPALLNSKNIKTYIFTCIDGIFLIPNTVMCWNRHDPHGIYSQHIRADFYQHLTLHCHLWSSSNLLAAALW